LAPAGGNSKKDRKSTKVVWEPEGQERENSRGKSGSEVMGEERERGAQWRTGKEIFKGKRKGKKGRWGRKGGENAGNIVGVTKGDGGGLLKEGREGGGSVRDQRGALGNEWGGIYIPIENRFSWGKGGVSLQPRSER